MLYRTRAIAVAFVAENKPSERAYKRLYIVRGENGADYRTDSEEYASIYANWLYSLGYAYRASLRYVSPLRVER